MHKEDKRDLLTVILGVTVGVIIDLAPGLFLWYLMHPITFWQRMACAVGLLGFAVIFAIPACVVAGFIFELFLD